MGISRMSVKRPIATLMCVFIVLAFGFISITNLKLDLYPNMNIPVAAVITTYDGVGSEEIEELITKPIEASMGTVSGLDTIISMTSNGSSFVIIQFEDDIDVDMAAIDMREKIDIVKYSLPDDANDPIVMKIDPNAMTSLMISATCEGMDITELKSLIENDVADRLERQSGVASVNVMGGREKEIRVVLKQDKIRGYGITESAVSGMLASENTNTPLGSIEQGDKNLTMRVKGEFKDLEEIKNIPFTTSSGATVYLRDFADVTEVYKDISSSAYTNGKPSINMAISKQSTANTVNMSDAVLKEMARIQKEMPEIEFLVINDPAEQINNSLSSVASSAIQGGVLAVIVLYIFLRNFRSTLVVGLAMPISIVATFALMYFADITLNLMSLGGLTLGVGMLVDSSIVVLESIYKKLEEGVDRFTAAVEGAREVGSSVFASALTTIAVFLPIPFFGGSVGQIFNDLSLTISFALISSLVVSLTFVPMCASVFLNPEAVANVHKRKNIFTKILDFVGYGISAIEAGYKFILAKALKFKKITIIITFAFIILTGMCIPSMGFEFMPSSDEGIVNIDITMPTGTKLAPTDDVAWKVVNAIEDIPEIENLSFTIGGGSGASSLTGGAEDSASITMDLVDKELRTRSSDAVAQEVRGRIKNIAGAQIDVSASSGSMGRYAGGGIQVNIKGEETDVLREIGNDFVDLIETIPGTSEVKTSLEEATPQTTIIVDREKASAYGITGASVAGIVRTAVSGSVATTYRVDGDEYDIRVMHDSDKINYINDVESILIPTNTGASIPLSEVAQIIDADTPATITREDQEKYISVTANLNGVDLGTANSQVEAKLKDYIMPKGYTYDFGGTTEQMNEAFGGLASALLLAIILVYMIMAAQFEAFSYPLMIMGSMPIAMTTGIMGLFIYGEAISITALLGLIMLAGTVVNNAIVLVDYANLLMRERDMDTIEAMKVAGPARLRPILMSTLTTVLAMIPMMISTATGSETMKGLATVVVFGLSFSTLITLLFIPVIYVGYNNIKNRIKRRFQRRKQKRLKNVQA